MPYKSEDKKREYDRAYQRRLAEAAKKQSAESRHPFCVVTKEGRVVRQDVLENYAIKTGGEETSRQMSADRFSNLYGSEKLIQPLYNPETLAQVAELNPYHAKCCQVKARDTAGSGYEIKPMVDNPSEEQRKRIQDFLDLQINLTDVFYRHQYDLEVISYGALEIVREGHKADTPTRYIYHIPAHTLRRHQDEIRIAQVRAGKKRWFKIAGAEVDVDWETGQVSNYKSLAPDRRATEVLWSTLYSQRSDYYGIADIIPALGAVHGDTARRDYNLNFFDNFGIPAYAVFITGDYDPGPVDEETGRTELEDAIRTHFQDLSSNPHSTLILTIPAREGGAGDVKIQFQPLAIDVKDASFRLFRKDNRDEVIIAHGVPAYRIGVMETGALGGNFASEATKIYKDSVISPRQEVLENLLNYHVFTGSMQITDWRFKFADVNSDDQERDITIMEKLFDMGAVRIRDVIQLYGDRFGLEDDPNDPLLDLRFVKGTAINAEESGQAFDAIDMATRAFADAEERLRKVARKRELYTPPADGTDIQVTGEATTGNKK